jgi:elongation factor G
MMTYETGNIRNIVLMGHTGSGKTTLAETMLFESGGITRIGTVEDGTTVSDFHDIEKDKKKSVYSSVMALDWRGYRINLIDTPGSLDYSGEVIGALRVAATAAFVINSEWGVEVGTERLWEYTQRFKTPSMFIVNKVDADKSDFNHTVEMLQESFGRQAVVVQYPLNEGIGFNSIIDVLKMTMYVFPNSGGKPEKKPIPASEKERAEKLHNELIEAIAENDATLMDRYFEQGTLDEDEMREGLRSAMVHHDLFPVFCVSARRNMGTGRIMGFLDNVAPSPLDAHGPELVDGSFFTVDPKGKPVAFLFKDHLEPHVGDLMFFKVYSGVLKPGMDLINSTTGAVTRLANLFTTIGEKRVEVQEVKAGDIAATVKLKDANISDTLCDKSLNIRLKPLEYPEPVIRMAVKPVRQGDEEKLVQALQQLHHEDPSLIVENSQELKQLLVFGQGEEHLSEVKYELEHRYKLPIEFYEPGIPYRETITKAVKAHFRHKKQTGGAGQFAEVHMIVEPYFEGMPNPPDVNVRNTEVIELKWGGKLVFNNCIVGGVIDARFLPSILKGVMEKMENGPLTGSYVRDVRVSVFDGSMHSVDSNDAAFKTASLQAFRAGFLEAKPQLLEPVYDIEVITPQEFMGDVMSDLSTRRAQILGMDAYGKQQKLRGLIPLSELHRYSTYLRSVTQGRASFTIRYNSYQNVPYDVQEKVIAKRKEHELEEA